jgi:hypothetical protein
MLSERMVISMNRHLRLLALMLATASAVVLVLLSPQDMNKGIMMPKPAAVIVADNPLGSHAMLFLNTPVSAVETIFAEAAAAGTSTIRVDIPLARLSEDGVHYDWTGVNTYMLFAAKYHIRVLADLRSTPYAFRWGGVPQYSEQSPSYPAQWGAMAGLIAAHTKGFIDDFEIWNEADGGNYSGTPQQFAAMLVAAADAIHRANPDAKVATPGMALIPTGAGGAWLKEVFSTPGLGAVASRIDIANVHLRGSIASVIARVKAWKAFFARWGLGDKPLWVTEAGCPADPRFQNKDANPDCVGGEAGQASYVLKVIPAAVGAGAAKVFISEHDDGLTGVFASEGYLASKEPLTANPIVRRRGAFSSILQLSDSWAKTGHF